MRIEIVMPQMGESTAEGTIIRWRKKIGDRIEKEEAILEISTDKVDSEIPSPASGILVAIDVGEGAKVPVGTVLATLETDPAEAKVAIDAWKTETAPRQVTSPSTSPAAASALPPEATQATTPAASRSPSLSPSTPTGLVTPVVPSGASVAFETSVVPPASPTHPPPAPVPAPVPRVVASAPAVGRPLAAVPGPHAEDGAPETGRFYSPLVRAIARREGVSGPELSTIQGSGLSHRVTKRDILGYIEGRRSSGAGAMPVAAMAAGGGGGGPSPRPASLAAATGPVVAARMPAPATVPNAVPAGISSGVEIVEMDTMRRAIAEHMVRSVHTSPHVASIHEVDMSRIVKARTAQMAAFERREGFKLTYTPFFLEASVGALKEFPWINSSVDGTKILVRKSINLGVAVALDNGLIVPVIKGADGLNFVGLARAAGDLATRARARKLTPDEVGGGTFTITNIGVFGTLTGTPIINQPQVAILGTGAIKKRVVVVDDAIAIRDIMYLSLSYDHRVVDGMMAGRFLARMATILESWDPARAL